MPRSPFLQPCSHSDRSAASLTLLRSCTAFANHHACGLINTNLRHAVGTASAQEASDAAALAGIDAKLCVDTEGSTCLSLGALSGRAPGAGVMSASDDCVDAR